MDRTSGTEIVNRAPAPAVARHTWNKRNQRDSRQHATTGAGQADPEAYLNGSFQTVGHRLDGHCD